MTNDKQIAVAKEAIERIFSNTDQSPAQIRIDLIELQNEISERLNALET